MQSVVFELITLPVFCLVNDINLFPSKGYLTFRTAGHVMTL